MSDVPFVDADADVSSEAAGRARELIPWLEDPMRCEECGSLCLATRTYSPEQVMIVDAWECPECESAFYRERY